MEKITKLHNEIKSQIQQLPHKKMSDEELKFVARYLGSDKKYLGVKTGDVLAIAKNLSGKLSELSIDELTELLSGLFFADSFEEHAIGGKIFTLIKPEVRQKITFSKIKSWLGKAKGWVEVDVICQSSYTGQEVQEDFSRWKKTIDEFSKSKIISLRRASLVLQTKPVREINDPRMRKLAFATINTLKHEKEVLITKAVSWLLRSLTFQNKYEVKKYLEENKVTLPPIAYRETMKKIETGKK